MQQWPISYSICVLEDTRALLKCLFPWCSYLRDSGPDKQVILTDINDFQGHTHKSTHTLSFLTLKMITRLMFSRVHNVTYYVVMKNIRGYELVT